MTPWGWRGLGAGLASVLVIAWILVLWAGGVRANVGDGGAAVPLVAETRGRIRFEVNNGNGVAAPVRGRWRVEKLAGGSPWLFTRYLPDGLVAEGPFATFDGRVDLELTLWDPGRYRLSYQVAGIDGEVPMAGSSMLDVRLEAVKVRNTLLLFAGLVALGLACGFAAGTLRRPGGGVRGGRPASALTVLALVMLAALAAPALAAPGTVTRAHHALGLIRWAPAMPAVKEPVRIQVSDVAREVSVAVTRDEDGRVFLRQRLPEWSGPAGWTFVFPDGAGYTVTVVADDLWEQAPLRVSALPPDRGQQFRSLALMLAVYAASACCGLAAARRNLRTA